MVAQRSLSQKTQKSNCFWIEILKIVFPQKKTRRGQGHCRGLLFCGAPAARGAFGDGRAPGSARQSPGPGGNFFAEMIRKAAAGRFFYALMVLQRRKNSLFSFRSILLRTSGAAAAEAGRIRKSESLQPSCPEKDKA